MTLSERWAVDKVGAAGSGSQGMAETAAGWDLFRAWTGSVTAGSRVTGVQNQVHFCDL